MLHELLETPGNLGLRKIRGMARLAFNDFGLAGLMGDVDANHACDTAGNGAVYLGHLWGSLQGDLRADLQGDPAVLPRDLGGRREEHFTLPSRIPQRVTRPFFHETDATLCHNLLIRGESSPPRSHHFLFP